MKIKTPPVVGILAFVRHDPSKLFWLFAGFHLLVWTLATALVSPNAPLDVIEGYAWGHEWLWGTHKHPPMQAWILETLALLTGRAHWAHFLASQIAVVIAFWAVWQMGRRILNEKAALVGVLLLEGITYYNFTSPEFNPNLLQLPFWALIGLYFYRAVEDDRIADWLLLGFWSACGLYTKYSTGLLLVTFAILLLAHKKGRKRLLETGPYLAFLTIFLLFLPHLIWLFQNDFPPVDYIISRIESPKPKLHLAQPGQFILSQALTILPMILLLVPILKKEIILRDKFDRLPSFDRAFLFTIVFGPFFIMLLISFFGVKVRDMWGTPFWSYVGLWVVSRFDIDFASTAMRRFAYAWGAIFTLILAGYICSIAALPYLTQTVQRVHYPGQAVANVIDKGWHEHYRAPLNFVIGDMWPAGNVAYYAPDRPHVFIKSDYTISPWIKAKNLKRDGGVLVWCMANCASHNYPESIPNFVGDYPQAQMQPPILLPRRTGAKVEPVKIGWAIVPPEKSDSNSDASHQKIAEEPVAK